MTSRSLKKRRITRPSISLATSSFALFTLVALAVEPSLAATQLQWGSSSVRSSTVPVKTHQSTAADLHHDANIVTAAWEDADTAPSTEQQGDPIYVAERHSVVIKRRNQFERDTTDSLDTDLSRERFAKLPDDPFDDPTIEDYQPPVEESLPTISEENQYDLFDEPVELFGQPDEANATEEADEPTEQTPADVDLFQNSHDSLNLFEESTNSAESLNMERFEISEDVSEEINEQEFAEDERVDLWTTSEEITPTEETELPSSSESEVTDIFRKLTEGDIESEDFAQRYDYQADELEREIIDDDPNDWLDYKLLLPDVEQLTEEERQKLEAERAENEKSCKEELEKVRAQKVENIDINIRVEGSAGKDYPFECNLGHEKPEPRDWPQMTYMWKASGLCHKPLYFEQVHLERYGHSWGPIAQPLLSGVHFFGTIPILPYKMGLKTPNECVYPLGYYRPGNCAPYMIDPFPFTWRAAGYQAGFATGMSFLLP